MISWVLHCWWIDWSVGTDGGFFLWWSAEDAVDVQEDIASCIGLAFPPTLMDKVNVLRAPLLNMRKARAYAARPDVQALHKEMAALPRCAKHGTVSTILFYDEFAKKKWPLMVCLGFVVVASSWYGVVYRIRDVGMGKDKTSQVFKIRWYRLLFWHAVGGRHTSLLRFLN